MTSSNTALLVLEDGTVFRGRAWGSRGRTLGEIVFSTGKGRDAGAKGSDAKGPSVG